MPAGDPSANNPQSNVMPQNAAALAIGGLVVVNSVHGGAAATITKADIATGTGAVTVTASEKATITATADSAATVKSADSYAKTAPASTGTGTGTAPTAAPGTPGVGTQTQTKSLALGGIIATNSVLGSAAASIVDSTVLTGKNLAAGTSVGGVAVTASNTATIDASTKTSATSDGAALALTLAFNTVGWKDQNVLFRAVDTITGQPLIAGAFQNDTDPAGASAQILRSTVTTGTNGAIAVAAKADAGIRSAILNKSSSSENVLKDASAYALGFVLTGNMVNTRALATIDNTGTARTIDAGGALSIRADSAGTISAKNALSALASLTKASLVEDFADKILSNYDYTRSSGEKNLTFGDLVYDWDTSVDRVYGVDKVYVYIGADAPVVLKDADFSDTTKWRLNNAREFLKFLPPGVLNLGESMDPASSGSQPATGSPSASTTTTAKPYAVAVSGILVSNDVRSTAEASLTNADVTRAGDVTVAAAQTGKIEASVTSKVQSKLKPGTKPGTKEAIAVGAVIAANVVTGSSTASVTGSKLGAGSDKTVGNVTVEAANTGTITATISSIVESAGTAVGVTAAFNKIGTSSQNVLFDLSDAILGTDLGTVIQGANAFAATASISGQPINATGLVKVSALSKATIAADIKNAVTTVGAEVTGVGAVVGLNFARLATSATLSGMNSVTASGVAVSALSQSKIDAVVTAPVISVAYRTQSTDPSAPPSGEGPKAGHTISVGMSIARNTIVDTALVAGIDEVGTVTATAGDVRVIAGSGATINATATATAVALLFSTEENKNVGVAVGGALGFNTILGGVDAHITNTRTALIEARGNAAPDAKGEGGQGNITVSATNTSSITAKIEAAAAAVIVGKGASQAVAVGVTLAFNMIGFYGSGLPTGTDFKNGTDRALNVTAGVSGTRLSARRKVTVEATSASTITATTLAAAVAVGASTGGSSGTQDATIAGSGGGLYVGNKIVTATKAVIDGTSSTDDGVSGDTNGITVAAADRSIIKATSVALAVSANLSGKSSGSTTQPNVAIGAAVANNEIQSDVAARILNVADLAGSGPVQLSVTRSADIFARTFAAAVGAQVSGQGSGFGVTGGGATALNTIGGSTIAELSGSVVGKGTGTDPKAGSLDVTATDTATIAALTGALALTVSGSVEGKASGVAVGASVANNVIGSGAAVRATLSGTPVRATGAVTVSARSNQTVNAITVATAVGVSASGTDKTVAVSLGGSAARNLIDIATTAEILGAVAIQAGSLSVQADNSSTIASLVGAASIAATFGSTDAVSVALAASIALNRIAGNVSASVTDATVTTLSGGVSIAATRTGTISTVAAAASVAVGLGGDKGVGVSGAGVAAVNQIDSSTTASAVNVTIDAQGAVAVSATSTATITADIVSAALSVGGGSASAGAGALGVSIAYNEIGRWTAYDEANNRLSESPALGGRAKVSATLTNSTVKATRELSVRAASGNTVTTNIAAIAVGVTASGNNSGAVTIGGTFAMSSIGLATEATIDGDRTGSGPGLDAASAVVSAQDASTITTRALSASLALAAAGSTAVSVAIGGSVALNTIANDVSANVKNVDRGLKTAGAILIEARSKGALTANAASAAISLSGSGSNAVAVSAAVTYARNVITTGTHARGTDSSFITTGTGGDITVAAEASTRIEAAILAAALAAGVSGSNGVGVGIGAAVAENRIGNWSQSGDGKETRYTLAGNGGTAVEAVLSGSSVKAAGALIVAANSSQAITAKVAAASAAIGGGGSAGVGVAAAGVTVVNAIAVATRAIIDGDGATGIEAGSIRVSAADASTIDAFAGSASLAGSGGGSAGVSVAVGFTLALNSIAGGVEAGIANADTLLRTTGAASVKLNDDPLNRETVNGVLVSASRAGRIYAAAAAAAISIAGGGSAGVGVSGGGAFAANRILGSVNATVDASKITTAAGGGLTVSAGASSDITAIISAAAASAGGGGSAGVGVALGASGAENRIGTWTTSGTDEARTDTFAESGAASVRASIKASTLDIAGALKVEATASQKISATLVAAAAAIQGGGAAGVSVSAAGAVAANAIGVITAATIDGEQSGSRSNVTAGSVTVSAANTAQISAVVGAASLSGAGGGAAGVGVAVGFALAINSIAGGVQASIGHERAGTSTVTTRSGGVTVAARNDARIRAASAAAAVSIGGGGAAGVSVSGGGAAASNVITLKTSAAVANGALTVRGGKSAVTASASGTIEAVITAAAAAAGGGGAAGVGVAVGVGVARNAIGAGNETRATLRNTSVDSNGALDVTATSNQTIRAAVAAVSASLQGVARPVSPSSETASAPTTPSPPRRARPSTVPAPPASRRRRSRSPPRTPRTSPRSSARPASPAAAAAQPASA